MPFMIDSKFKLTLEKGVIDVTHLFKSVILNNHFAVIFTA